MAGAKPTKPKQKQVRGPKIPSKMRKDALLRGADKPPTDQQEKFALEYLVDFDRLRALAAAGYKTSNLKSANATASYLLALPNVRMLVARKKADIAERLGLEAESTLRYMKMVFLEAFSERDYTAAMKALTEIGRVYGIYEADHNQKSRTPEDVARIKAQLEMMGVDFSRKNFPPELIGVPSGGTPRVLVANTLTEDSQRDDSRDNGTDGTTATISESTEDSTDVRGTVSDAVGENGSGVTGSR